MKKLTLLLIILSIFACKSGDSQIKIESDSTTVGIDTIKVADSLKTDSLKADSLLNKGV
jgi:hypothetical protein